jgi:DNA end-binding protein Ku
MAARAIASGTISFGLVSIPIKLYSTSESSAGISFNLLHAKCKGRLKQQYICPTDDNEIVNREDMVKGFEFSKGQYVTFTAEELEAVEETASKAIEITEFVPAEKIDPVYVDKMYYVGPDKGGDRPYKLLGEAMRRTGRAALAKYAARGKQYLVLVTPRPDGLIMQQLHYADEVRSFSEVPVGEAEIKEAELKLAVQIVEQISNDEFHPENYRDEVKDRVLAQVQRKVEGQEITATAAPASQAQIIDLMEALKASLQLKGPAKAAPEAKEEQEAKPAPKRKRA